MAVNNKTDNHALDKMNQNMDEAWLSGDLDGFMTGFTENVIWMPPGQAPVVGKKSCSEWVLKNNPQLFGGQKQAVYERFTSDLEEVELSDGHGFFRSVITMVMPADENGNSPAFRIKGLNVVERQTDGEWKISRYMWNSYPIEE